MALSEKTKSAFAHSANMDLPRLSKYLKGDHRTSIECLSEMLECNGFVLRIEVQPLPATRPAHHVAP